MLKKGVIKGIAIGAFCLSVFPLIVTVFGSFMSSREMMGSAHILPLDFTLRQYETVLLKTPQYLLWFWNSVEISFLTVALAVIISLMAGYAFSKFRFPARNALFFVYIVVMLMPFQATLVPQYIMLKSLNLLNTKASVILPSACSAFGAFMMTQYMKGISDDIMEAAKLDGMNAFSIFIWIIIPLSKPAVSALVILLFIESWAMIEQPMTFISDITLHPLSLHLGDSSSALYAGGVVFLILPLLIYLFGHDDLIDEIGYISIK